jgi:hypothetical protein
LSRYKRRAARPDPRQSAQIKDYPLRKHRTTSERRAVVKKMASMMLKGEEISSLLSISSKTLERRYRREIDEGRAQARLTVEAVIYKRITSSDKGMATANLQRWWMDRNFPVENNATGKPIRALVTVNLPDNGRGLQPMQPITTRRAPKLIEIEGGPNDQGGLL